MSTMAETKVTTQVYRVYIRAEPEAIWDAITKPEWTQKYGYRGIVEFDGMGPGSTYRILAPPEMKCTGMPDVMVDGEVVEADPPRKLVQTWHPSGTRRSPPRPLASPTTSRRMTGASRGSR
jgi:uncharacterized protein YndB with AHSA1/START domain